MTSSGSGDIAPAAGSASCLQQVSDESRIVTKLLLRASKSPFQNLTSGPIPRKDLRRVYEAQHLPGTMNVGNLVFAHSVYKALSAPGVDIDIDDYRLTLEDTYADEAELINEAYDAFVLPLCNAFRVPYRNSLVRMTRTIKRLRIPCIVTGVGAQFSIDGGYDELASIDDAVRDFVSAVLDRSASISVRGEITRDYLLHLGFPTDSVDVIGCPSMFYNGTEMNVRKGPLQRIAFNHTPMSDPRILPLTRYFNDHTQDVTFVPQTRSLMLPFSKGKYPDPNTPISPENPPPRLFQPGKVEFIGDVVPWIDFMRGQSLAIGTRIHGNIVALLADTPAHVVVHDTRTLELARYFEIPHTLLGDLEGFDVRTVYERSDYEELNRNHPKRLRTYADFLEKNGLSHILYDADAMRRHEASVRKSLERSSIPTYPEAAGKWRRLKSSPARLGRVWRKAVKRLADKR